MERLSFIEYHAIKRFSSGDKVSSVTLPRQGYHLKLETWFIILQIKVIKAIKLILSFLVSR